MSGITVFIIGVLCFAAGFVVASYISIDLFDRGTREDNSALENEAEKLSKGFDD